MKKSLMVANAILLTCILVLDVFYMIYGGIVLKGTTSLLFVLTGVINLNYCRKNNTTLKFPIWMLIALTFGMLGDILLNINFPLGAAVFGIGHIIYLVAYSMLEKFNRRDLMFAGVIAVISLLIITFTPFLNFGDPFMKGICCTYAVVISLMLGKAISNVLKENNPLNKLIVIGSILFFISDFMLMLDVFGNISEAGYLCLGTYYPAQFLLAFSLCVHAGVSILELKEGYTNLNVFKLKKGTV